MSDFVKDTNVPTNDSISRQAAIEAKQEFRNPNVVRGTEARTAYDRTYANGWNDCNSAWIDAINALPSAQPERNKGKWLRYGEDGYPNDEDTVFWQCDQCLEQYTGRTRRIPNFCPNCGARMTEEDV